MPSNFKWPNFGEAYKALESHIKCSEIRKEDPAVGPEHDSTLNAIDNAIRLAKDLGKENELPEWMKNN